MSRRAIIIIVVVGVLVIGSLIGFFIWLNAIADDKVSWKPSFEQADKMPYGTHVLTQLLEGYFEDHELEVLDKQVKESLAGKVEKEQGLYVFMGKRLYMDSTDIDSLLRFVHSGKQALLAANELPGYLEYAIDLDPCFNWDEQYRQYNSFIELNFYHDNLKETLPFRFPYVEEFDTTSYYWSHFGSDFYCNNESKFIELGNIEGDYVNFLKIPYGDGEFYLHRNPLVFTNFYLLQDAGVKYATKVFSHFKEGDIYWDEKSREFLVTQNTTQEEYNNMYANRSTLEYVLSQRSFQWATGVLMALSLLYIFVHVKRKQRTVPVLEPKTNTSLKFIQTLGDLYFHGGNRFSEKRNHRYLAQLKMKLFLSFLRNRYGINKHEFTQKDIRELAERSSVEQETIESIFEQFAAIEHADTINRDTLIRFHHTIDQFQKNCK